MNAFSRTRPTYDELLEENRWLREQLGHDIAEHRIALVQNALNLGRGEARLLMLLHARRGLSVSAGQAEAVLPSAQGRAGDRTDEIIKTWVWAIRRRLGRETIITHRIGRYGASPEIIKRIDALLEESK